MSFSLTDIFVLTSLGQGLFIGMSIMTSVFFRSRSNTYFGISILMLTLMIFFEWLDPETGLLGYLWSIMWEFLFPILLFHYFTDSLRHRFRQASWLIWLYVPFAITFILDTFWGLSYYLHVYELPMERFGPIFEWIGSLENDLSLLYNLLLISWSYKIILADETNEPIKVKWLKRLCLFILAILATWFIAKVLDEFYDRDYSLALQVAAAIFLWWVCYYGIYRLRLVEQAGEIHAVLTKKHEKRNLGPSRSGENRYLQKLDALMVEEQLFKDPNLGRRVVAERLGISEGYLSQLMGTVSGESFVDYVNRYRTEAAKEMLGDRTFNKYALEAIGIEAGFNSKSAFYTTFKKNTDHTPGTFRKLAQKS